MVQGHSHLNLVANSFAAIAYNRPMDSIGPPKRAYTLRTARQEAWKHKYSSHVRPAVIQPVPVPDN